MKPFAICSIIIAVLFGFSAFGTDTTASAGTVANIDGEHRQLVLTLCFGIFLVCGVVAIAAENIMDTIKRR